MKTTKEVYSDIMASEVFRLNGPEIDLPAALIELAQAVQDEDETDWSMGESTEACLSDLLPGAYWALSEWHAGQDSDSYAALCAIGHVFNPGMTSAPESSDDDSCHTAYELIGQWFEKQTACKA